MFEHKYFKDFYENYEIKNGKLASQTNLNKSITQLKKEVDHNFSVNMLIAGTVGFKWEIGTEYLIGEIVWYSDDPDALDFQLVPYKAIKDSNNKRPSDFPDYWTVTNRGEWTTDLDPSTYLHINRPDSMPYIPIGMYNPSTKKYVDDRINWVADNGNFLSLNRTDPYTPTGFYHPSTKKYVDDSIKAFRNDPNMTVNTSTNTLSIGGIPAENNLHVNKINDPNSSSNDKYGMFIGTFDDRTDQDWIRTTASGLLPYTLTTGNNSDIGSSAWKFSDIWCQFLHTENLETDQITSNTYIGTNIGTSTQKFDHIYSSVSDINQIYSDFVGSGSRRVQKVYADELNGILVAPAADIAEKYESDKKYEAGTVLGIGTDTEVTLFKEGMKLAGVVSTDPAVKLNESINGVYVALKGRVPVHIKGTAKRGQYIDAHKDGIGIACDFKTDLTIGICISNHSNNIVEVKI